METVTTSNQTAFSDNFATVVSAHEEPARHHIREPKQGEVSEVVRRNWIEQKQKGPRFVGDYSELATNRAVRS